MDRGVLDSYFIALAKIKNDINDGRYIGVADLQNFMIEITDSPDIKQWSDFVYNHEYGNIFQTPEMTEVSKRTKNYEPVSLAVVDKKR